MATSKYEELLNMAYRATNGAGAAFSKDEQGTTYVTPAGPGSTASDGVPGNRRRGSGFLSRR